MISLTFRPSETSDKTDRMSVNEIVDILDRRFPNFHRTKNINAEVGKALNQLGYQPHKTNACQVYYLKENDYRKL